MLSRNLSDFDARRRLKCALIAVGLKLAFSNNAVSGNHPVAFTDIATTTPHDDQAQEVPQKGTACFLAGSVSSLLQPGRRRICPPLIVPPFLRPCLRYLHITLKPRLKFNLNKKNTEHRYLACGSLYLSKRICLHTRGLPLGCAHVCLSHGEDILYCPK